MNADILKRVVRAIADGSQTDLESLVKKIIDSERDNGHGKLAQELETILKRPKLVKSNSKSFSDSVNQLKELPLSKRYGESLVTCIVREQLEHHMVLPDPIEQRFARIEKEFAARQRLESFGLKSRKTILIHGVPGCGKSLGAKRLAWNLGLPLLKVRFDALISSYFGESASNLRSVFEIAKQTPCVLLLDECDFIARARGNAKDIGEASRIVNSLLQLMEDYDAPGLLVATTNIESSLDDALFRRFDDIFQIPLPGKEEIEKLLRMTLSSVKVAPKTSWAKLTNKLLGTSAAMVVKSAQDAAKSAVLNGENVVTEQHLEKAIAELKRNNGV